ncbi:uncharacterized protein LOC115209836 [Argonauta hians]
MSSCLLLLFFVFVLLFTFGEFVRLSQENSCNPSCSILPKKEDSKLICEVHKEDRCHNVKRELEYNQSKLSSSSIANWQKQHHQSNLDIPASRRSSVTDVTANNTTVGQYSSSSSSSSLSSSAAAAAHPQIAGITIHDEQRSCFNDYRRNNFALNFTLLLPSGQYLYKTTALLLKIEYDVQPSKNSKCRIFELKNLGAYPEQQYDKRYIQYNFLTRFEKFKTHVFKVKLIALPTGENTTYIVTAYVNSLNVNKKRTIAVSIDSENSLHVVFEPSRHYVADSYNVSLIQFPTLIPDPITSIIVQQHQLPGNLTDIEFTDVQPGNYQIQVSVVSSDCEVQLCKIMNSTSFVMGSPQKNTAHRVPNKAVTTTTTTTTFVKHRISSTSAMMKTTTPETRSTSRRQGDVVIQPSDQSGEYERSLKIMLGTVFGVVGSVTIIIVVFCMYRKRNYTSGSHIEHPQLSDVIIEEFDMKQHFPNVLLLYSSDCCAHEYVVQAMAAFLMQICNCNVHIDLFEEHVIQEKGLNDWLLDNMQEAEYIIVLCSVGSRLRCKKNMQFKLHPHRTIPDYFALAVDYVAEKMRIERCKGMSLSKFIVLYMDYSVEGDIPAQLDLAQKFMMMRDVSNLVCHLHGLSLECSKFSPFSGITTKNYDKSEVGQRLKVAIEQAKQYFKDNPCWVEDHLEQVPRPVGCKFKSKHSRHSSGEPLLRAETKIEKAPPAKQTGRHASFSYYLNSQRDIFGIFSQDNTPVSSFFHSRLNSLPSSLNSHSTLTPFSLSTHTSHSYENISQTKKLHDSNMFFGEPVTSSLYPPIPPYKQQQPPPAPHLQQQPSQLSSQQQQSEQCHQQPHNKQQQQHQQQKQQHQPQQQHQLQQQQKKKKKKLPQPQPPPPPPLPIPQQQQQQLQSPQSESEEGFEVQRGKSQSLPVVSRTAKSLTVLEAEVHKEWDPESKPLPGDSPPPTEGDSSSNEGELELDLLSIKIPTNFRHVFYSPQQDPAELVPCLYNNNSNNNTSSVTYRPNHKRGSSMMGPGHHQTNSTGFAYHRASEDIRSLCRQLPTLEPLPRCVSLDDGSSTSYDSVIDQIINGGPNLMDGNSYLG